LKTVFYYVSGHGFGHAVRSALVIRELYRRGVRTEIFTPAPRFIFESNLNGIDFGYHHQVCDIGVVQSDYRTNDLPATLEAWNRLLDNEKEWLKENLAQCERLKPAAIVSDIVPPALRLADAASLPAILVATFTWEQILRFYEDDDPAFAHLADRVAEYYRLPKLLIHTPLSFGLSNAAGSVKVPLIGKKSGRSREKIRRELGLGERDAFLVSFGGTGAGDIHKFELEKQTDRLFLFLDRRSKRDGNLITFDSREVDHADLVKVSRAVITKPGYGIACESILNRTPMIYSSRGKFAEYEPLVKELKKYIPMRYIPPEELLGGGLRSYLETELEFSKDHLTDPGGGEQKTADLILRKINT